VSDNPTASALERVLACTASHVLPATYDAPGEPAERGTAIAKFIRDVVAGMSPHDASVRIPIQWRATCQALDWAKLTGGLTDVRGEVAYALDTATDEVTELGINIGRNYPKLSPTQIGGTVDIEGMSTLGHPVVIDVKSGQDVTPAAENAQIRYFARIAQLRHGAEMVEARIAYVAEDGSVTLDVAFLDTFDLDSFGDELVGLVSNVKRTRLKMAAGEPVPVRAGDHCKYCPAMNACPAYVGIARHMLPMVEAFAGPEAVAMTEAKKEDLEAVVASRFTAMTPDELGAAYLKLKQIERLADAVAKGIKAMAERQDIPLPDGRTLKKIPMSRKSFNQDRAIGLILDLGANNDQIASCYIESEGHQIRPVGSKTGAPKKTREKKRSAA
jgi:hypothetical protein